MSHKAGYVVALAVGGLLATAGLAQRPERAVAAGPADRAAAQPTRWEYATLRFKFMSGKWEWLSGEQQVTAEKSEVYRALGGVPRGDKSHLAAR